MPNVTLPDGTVKSYDQSLTVADVASSIGSGLAKAAIAGEVDGQLVDTSFMIENDSDVFMIIPALFVKFIFPNGISFINSFY